EGELTSCALASAKQNTAPTLTEIVATNLLMTGPPGRWLEVQHGCPGGTGVRQRTPYTGQAGASPRSLHHAPIAGLDLAVPDRHPLDRLEYLPPLRPIGQLRHLTQREDAKRIAMILAARWARAGITQLAEAV